MNRTSIAGLVALVPVLLAGCEIGGPAAYEDPEPDGSFEGTQPEATPLPTEGDTRSTPTSVPAGDEEAAGGQESAREGSDAPIGNDRASCLEWTPTGPRLAPCLIVKDLVNPLDHDDPDPWRPVPRSAFPDL